MSGLQTWLPAQDSPEVIVNENFDALSHMAVYAKDPTTTTGLIWGYLGGRWGGHLVAAGTLTLQANSTLYVTVARASGVIVASTSNAAWGNTTAHARVYKLTTGAATVTLIEDHRGGVGGVHGVGAAAGALSGLSDVNMGVPTNGQIFTWSASQGKAIWADPPEGGGGGPGDIGDAKIIGIVLAAEGGGAGAWQRIGADFEAVNADTAYFATHPTYAGIVGQTIDGQAMIKVPAFYVRAGLVPSGTYAGKRYWMVSDRAVDGFALHPAFKDAGLDLEQFWIGKYQGTNDGGTKLGSQAGNAPRVAVNFSGMRGLASARNTAGVTGFALWNIYHLSAIQVLCLIEIGGANSQALIGQGHVSGSSVLNVDNPTVAQASWRGIVGLWGNVWQMVDGIRISGDGTYSVWDAVGTESYQGTSQVAPPDGYPTKMSTDVGEFYDLRALFMPSATASASSAGSTGDRYWRATNAFAYHGGTWSGGADAGLFYMLFHGGDSSSATDIGGRLVKV